jgi:hypothetical protein
MQTKITDEDIEGLEKVLEQQKAEQAPAAEAAAV